MISNRDKALLINAALIVASVVQLVRGYRFLVVFLAYLTFFVVANLMIYIKVRADRRRLNPNYVSRWSLRNPGEAKPTMRQFLSPRERDKHRMDGPR